MEKYLWLHDDCVPTKYTLVQDYFTVGRAINSVTVHKLGRGRQNTWTMKIVKRKCDINKA